MEKPSKMIVLIILFSLLLSPIAPVLAEESAVIVVAEENSIVVVEKIKDIVPSVIGLELVNVEVESTALENTEKDNGQENKNTKDEKEINGEEERDDLVGVGKTDDRDFMNIVRQTTEYTCGPAALATLI